MSVVYAMGLVALLILVAIVALPIWSGFGLPGDAISHALRQIETKWRTFLGRGGGGF